MSESHDSSQAYRTEPVRPKRLVRTMPQANLSTAAAFAMLIMLAPFTLYAYLPALPAIVQSLGSTPERLQLTLSVYFCAFSASSLIYGALSDSIGRRPVLLAALAAFILSSIGCAFATNLPSLLVFRTAQGATVSASVVLSYAIVRDAYDSLTAQRLIAQALMIYNIGPTLAPLVGTTVLVAFGWPAIFGTVAATAATLFAWVWFCIPETRPIVQETHFSGRALLHSYGAVLKSSRFYALTLLNALNYSGAFVYVASWSAMLIRHLGATTASFTWLFLPMVAGHILGGLAAAQIAARWGRNVSLRLGYLVMGGAAVSNIIICSTLPPNLIWNIAPIAIYAFGYALAAPSLVVTLLDFFPAQRGTVTALRFSFQLLVLAIVASVIAPVASRSLSSLAWVTLAMFVTSLLRLLALGRGNVSILALEENDGCCPRSRPAASPPEGGSQG